MDLWDLEDLWDLVDQWDPVDLWVWALVDTWEVITVQWVLEDLWDLVDLSVQAVQWGPVDRWTWVQMVRWVVTWDTWGLRWEWDRCHPCQDRCQCPPWPTCQCLQWAVQWVLGRVQWADLEGQCLGQGVQEDPWDPGDRWDLEDQWDLDQEDLWEDPEAREDLCQEDRWDLDRDRWEDLEAQCLVLEDLGDRWDQEVQWDLDPGDQWGDLEGTCRSHHQEP